MIQLRPENRYKDAYLPEENELQNGSRIRPEWLENMADDPLIHAMQHCPQVESLMPVFPVPEGETSTSLLEKKWHDRIAKTTVANVDEAYEERLAL